MLELKKLEIFLCAAESSSLSEAAKQLHLSQTTVSYHIKTLEQELRIELFERSNTGLRLTEAGRLLLPWARRILHDADILQSMMSSSQNVAGELRIACSTTAGKYILPQLAARFRKRYPGIRVKIPTCASEKVVLDLLNGDVHLGVMSREVMNPNLEIQDFFYDTIVLIVPAHHCWSKRASIELSELREKPIIMREPTSGTRRVVLEELARYNISLEDLNIFLELGNTEAIVRTVADGYGVAFVSELAAAYPLELGAVVAVHVEGLLLQRKIFMARKSIGKQYRPRDAFWSFVHSPENVDLLHLPQIGINK